MGVGVNWQSHILAVTYTKSTSALTDQDNAVYLQEVW